MTSNNFIYNLPHGELFVVGVSDVSDLPTWLLFSFLLYSAGLLGMVFNFKNFLVTMMSIELMYLGAIMSFVMQAAVQHDIRSAVYALILLILAACESAIGLGILIVLYRFSKSVGFNEYQQLAG